MIGYSIAIHSLTLLLQAAPSVPGALTPEQIQQIALQGVRHRPPQAEGILVPLAFFAFLAFLVWQRMLSRRRRAQAQADLQKQLLDKFTSGPELASFLESPGGQRFLAQLHSEGTDARAQIARSLRTGIIVLAVGAALLILKARLAGVDPHQQTGFLIGGVILFALGLGFLVSAAVSHRLAKHWDADQKTGGPTAPIS